MHPVTDQTVAFPEPLEDVRNFTPEMILAWARSVVLSFELEHYAEQIKEAKVGDKVEGD